MGYLNVVKYPPAMTFTLLTMGVNLIVLGLMARARGVAVRLLEPLTVFGRVPMFFYIAHLYLYSVLGAWLAPNGTSIGTMYLYWLGGLVLLFPACLWYGNLKNRHRDSLLRFV